MRTIKMTAVGFEPTQLALVELESTPLDHSGKLSLDPLAFRPCIGLAAVPGQWQICEKRPSMASRAIRAALLQSASTGARGP